MQNDYDKDLQKSHFLNNMSYLFIYFYIYANNKALNISQQHVHAFIWNQTKVLSKVQEYTSCSIHILINSIILQYTLGLKRPCFILELIKN